MAKNSKAPVPAINGTVFDQPYFKKSSLSPEQGCKDPMRYGYFDREDYRGVESGQKISPAQPNPGREAWGRGSYCSETGRAARVADSGKSDCSSRTEGNAGRHTEGSPGQGRRPGRW